MDRERGELLAGLEAALELPMALLGLVWLVLMAFEFVRGLPPFLEALGIAIWVLFILDFGLKLLLAPRKRAFLRVNALTALSLLLPALRIVRAARLLRAVFTIRAVRGMRLLRVFGSLNRGMRSLGAGMSRRGFGYVLALTMLVLIGGSAGMYAFEGGARAGFRDYGEALWWTAMILTTMGSGYWPETPEGRILCILLALYAFGVFGYFTAALASFFVGREAEDGQGDLADARRLEAFRKEVAAALEELRAVRTGSRPRPTEGGAE